MPTVRPTTAHTLHLIFWGQDIGAALLGRLVAPVVLPLRSTHRLRGPVLKWGRFLVPRIWESVDH
jgi:hypothetical protein